MDKAEEFILNKKMSLHPKIIMYTHKEVCDFLDEYAQQVSRDKAILFGYFVRDKIDAGGIGARIDEYFDEWIKNQQ